MPNVHPLIVHFPIALFSVAVICELLAYFRKSPLMNLTALVTAVGAALGAVAAVVTGLLAESIVPAFGEAHTAVESHKTLGLLVLASAVAFALLKIAARVLRTDRLLTAQLMVGFAGVVITFMAAYEGGELIYKHGVGVDKNTSDMPTSVNTMKGPERQ